MSLRVWLPFIKDTAQQGLSSTSVTAIGSGATLNDYGKLGKCYYFDGTTNGYMLTDFSTNVGVEDFSIALWVKIPTITSGSYFTICSSKGQSGASAGLGIYWNYSQKKFLWSTSDGTATEIWQADTVDTIVYDKWIHLVMVRDSADAKHGYFYINGIRYELVSIPAIRNITASTSTLYLGKISNGAYPLKMYLNDFRFYNHALSPKEVKLLSQGLVCHYPLNQPFSLNNLVRNSLCYPYNNYGSSGSTATVVKTGSYNNCDIYRLTYTPNDTSLSSVQAALFGHGIYGYSYTFKANTKYAFWILWKPISHPDTVCGGTASNIGGWTEIPNRYFGGGWYEVGQYRNGTVTTDKTDNIFVSFKCPSATSGTPVIIDFCCPHLIEGYDYIMPENDYQLSNDNSVYDCSGFGHTGIKSGELTTSSDTPRNSISTTFATSQHINTTITSTGYANSYTFAWWGKFGNCNGHMMWGFANGNRLNLYCFSNNSYWNTGDGASNPFNVPMSPYLDSKFHHFAVTGDGTTVKLYVDGEFKGNATTYQGITGTNLYFNGWDASSNYNFNGGLSDFRLYTTALSAEDVLALYNAPVSIANNGSMFTQGEFVEI